MNNWKDQIEWDDLIDEILNEQCILVIGPDLVNYANNQTLFQILSKDLKQEIRLHKHVDINSPYIFEHEELLQLQPNGRDTSLYSFLRDFYDKRIEFDAPFKQIAHLPFHLIISLLPDQRLGNIFTKEGKPFAFDYYPRTKGSERRELFQLPSTDIPLIYNMMGVLNPADAVLTFDNLFEYLQGILGDRPLPVLLDGTLKRAKSFIFLGVHFEKWYMQVLLRIFVPTNSSQDRKLKYSLLRDEQNDTFTFIARRLELDFLPIEPLDFLHELYKRFSEKDLLKKSTTKKIFVSYSHSNMATVTKLCNRLKDYPVEIIVDEASMPAGDKIRSFMKKVGDVDKFIVLLSESSLQSPWVSKEISLAVANNNSIIPCHLDLRFLDKNLVDDNKKFIAEKLREVNRLIADRKEADPLDAVPDLSKEEELWRDFGRDLPKQIALLQGSKSIALDDKNFDNGFDLLIQNLLD